MRYLILITGNAAEPSGNHLFITNNMRQMYIIVIQYPPPPTKSTQFSAYIALNLPMFLYNHRHTIQGLTPKKFPKDIFVNSQVLEAVLY